MWRSLYSIFSGVYLFASTSSAEMDKNIFASKHHFLFTAAWSTLEQLASHMLKALPEDTGHLPSISLGQSCLHLQWDSHMVMLCSLLLHRAGCVVSAQVATPVWSRSTYMHGDGIPSSQRPQLVKLLKEMPNGEVCLESLVSLHRRTSLNSLLIIGITH